MGLHTAVHGGSTAEMADSDRSRRTSAPGDIDKFLKARGTRYVPIAKKRQQNADHKVRAQYKKLKAKLGVSGPRGQTAEPSSEPDSQPAASGKKKRSRANPLTAVRKSAEAVETKAKAEGQVKRTEEQARFAENKKRRTEKKNMSRKLNMRTKRGQPIMKHHMDNLLEKIQQSM